MQAHVRLFKRVGTSRALLVALSRLTRDREPLIVDLAICPPASAPLRALFCALAERPTPVAFLADGASREFLRALGVPEALVFNLREDAQHALSHTPQRPEPPPVPPPSLIETPDGLRIDIRALGPGPRLLPGDAVTVDYRGDLGSGTITFWLGEGRVLPGMEAAMGLLTRDSHARLTVPPNLGFGARQAGALHIEVYVRETE